MRENAFIPFLRLASFLSFDRSNAQINFFIQFKNLSLSSNQNKKTQAIQKARFGVTSPQFVPLNKTGNPVRLSIFTKVFHFTSLV